MPFGNADGFVLKIRKGVGIHRSFELLIAIVIGIHGQSIHPFISVKKTFLSVLLSGSWLPSVCRKPTHAFEEHLLVLIKTLAMFACKHFPWDLLFGRCLSSPQGVVRL